MSRPRTLLLVSVGVLLLCLVASGTTVWLMNRSNDEGDTSAGRTGALNVRQASIDNGISILGEPDRTWEFSVWDVTSDGTLLDMQSLTYDTRDVLLAFPDVYVVQAVAEDDYGDLDNAELLGVDRDDGDLIWRHELDEGGSGCWQTSPSGLYCAIGNDDDDADNNQLVRIDPSDGRTIAEATINSVWGSLVHQHGTLFLATPDFGSGDPTHNPALLEAYDADTLAEQWKLQLEDSLGPTHPGDVDIYDAGPSATFRQGVLEINFGELRWRVDPDTHMILSYETGFYGNDVQSDEGYTVTWTDDSRIDITDGSGRTVLNTSDELWSDGNDYIEHGRVGVGSRLVDLSSGAELWTRDDLVRYDDYGLLHDWSWAVERRVVVVGLATHDVDDDYDPRQTSGVVLDGKTGKTLFEVSDTTGPMAGTDDAFVTIQDGEVRTHSLKSGDVVWQRPLSDERNTLLVTSDAVVAVGKFGFTVLTDFPASGPTGRGDDREDGGDTAYVTACGTPPKFTPKAAVSANGGVTITYTVTAVCPGGQWLNHSQLSVPFVVDGNDYASGYFDFSDDPYWIPDGGVDLTLVYPFENTQAPVSDISRAISDRAGGGSGSSGSNRVIEVPCEPGPDNTLGTVPGDPSYGADPEDPSTADGAPDESTDDDRNETALEALKRIASEDLANVEALGTNWTAQLSSKKPGTRDDGIVYDSYDDILALHLQHRARYPDSLLVYSSDWAGSFGPSSQDYWVTLSGASEAVTRPVLGWCTSEGWGPGDCWAKRLRHSGDPELNTDKANPDDRNN